jgi:hypothetical protein
MHCVSILFCACVWYTNLSAYAFLSSYNCNWPVTLCHLKILVRKLFLSSNQIITLVTPCPVQWLVPCSFLTGIIFFLTPDATINPLYVLCVCVCVCVNIMHTCTNLALTKSLLCLNILVSKNCSYSGLCVTRLFKAVWKEIMYETHFVLRGSWTTEKLKILEKWDGFRYQRNLALFCISHFLSSWFERETSIRAEVHQHFLEGGIKVLNLHKLCCR